MLFKTFLSREYLLRQLIKLCKINQLSNGSHLRNCFRHVNLIDTSGYVIKIRPIAINRPLLFLQKRIGFIDKHYCRTAVDFFLLFGVVILRSEGNFWAKTRFNNARKKFLKKGEGVKALH